MGQGVSPLLPLLLQLHTLRTEKPNIVTYIIANCGHNQCSATWSRVLIRAFSPCDTFLGKLRNSYRNICILQTFLCLSVNAYYVVYIQTVLFTGINALDNLTNLHSVKMWICLKCIGKSISLSKVVEY